MLSQLASQLGLDRFEWKLPELIEFHAAAAHFPIALLLTSVFFEVFGLVTRKKSARDAAFYAHLAGVAGAAVTVASGWFGNPWANKTNEIAQTVNVHRWWGVATLVIFTLLAAWRIWERARQGDLKRWQRGVFATLTLLGVLVVSVTGYMGGNLMGGHDEEEGHDITERGGVPADAVAPADVGVPADAADAGVPADAGVDEAEPKDAPTSVHEKGMGGMVMPKR